MNSIKIRESTIDDINSITNAFYFFLEEIQDCEKQDLTLCENNVELFRLLLRSSIENLEICPLIASVDGKDIGFTFWIQVLGFNLKEQTVNAFGTYVDPKFRKLGIAKILALKSFEILKARGIKKIVGKLIKENEEYISEMGFKKEEMICKIL